MEGAEISGAHHKHCKPYMELDTTKDSHPILLELTHWPNTIGEAKNMIRSYVAFVYHMASCYNYLESNFN